MLRPTQEPNDTIRVLHVTRAEVLGIRTFLCGLLANMDSRRFELKVASPCVGPLLEDLRRMNVPALPCFLERDIALISDLRSLVQLCRLLRSERPHILHLHGAKAGFLGRIAGWWCRVPGIVYTPNNDYLDEPMSALRRRILIFLEQQVARLGACIVSVSEEERRGWLRRNICPPDRILTIHDGFDFSRASSLIPKDRAKRLLGVPSHCRVAGLIARLVPQKAPHIFLQAAAIALRANPDLRFLVVGDGPLRDELHAVAVALKIEAQVLFLGYLENLSNVYSAMDVCVLTSLYEGLPMVVLECMYLGIPMVASQTYGVTEVLDRGCGIVTPVLDPDATARAMLTILDDESGAEEMRRKARLRVVTQFGAEQMAAHYQNLYFKMMRAPEALRPAEDSAEKRAAEKVAGSTLSS